MRRLPLFLRDSEYKGWRRIQEVEESKQPVRIKGTTDFLTPVAVHQVTQGMISFKGRQTKKLLACRIFRGLPCPWHWTDNLATLKRDTNELGSRFWKFRNDRKCSHQ